MGGFYYGPEYSARLSGEVVSSLYLSIQWLPDYTNKKAPVKGLGASQPALNGVTRKMAASNRVALSSLCRWNT
jgi:hypothetical protein